jgi:hypothetical protein
MSTVAFKIQQGATPLTWSSGGSPTTGPNYLWTPTGILDAVGRAGAKGDLAQGGSPAVFARRWAVLLTTAVASAAADYKGIELYWSPSNSATLTTNNAADLTGADVTVSGATVLRAQLMLIGVMSLSNAKGTAVQKQWFPEFFPPTRYGIPMIYNASAQSLSSTAGDHTLTMVPIEETGEY